MEKLDSVSGGDGGRAVGAAGAGPAELGRQAAMGCRHDSGCRLPSRPAPADGQKWPAVGPWTCVSMRSVPLARVVAAVDRCRSQKLA